MVAVGGATLIRNGYRAAAVGVAIFVALALAMPVGAAGSAPDDAIPEARSSDADVSGDPIDGEIYGPLSPLPDLGFTFGPVAGAGKQASGELARISSLPSTPLAILNIEEGGVTVGSSPGFDGQILGTDVVIEVGLASEATVVFFDASVLQLGPGTRIQLSDVRRPGEADGEITIFQWVGTTWSVVTSFTDSQTLYQVETPSGIGIVRGTEFLTNVSGDGDSKFGVVEGDVTVKSKKGDDTDDSANVTSGSSASVTPDPTSEGPIVSDWQPSDQESSELDRARDQHDDAKAALADATTVATGDGADSSWDSDADADGSGISSDTGSNDGSGSGGGTSSDDGSDSSGETSSDTSSGDGTSSDTGSDDGSGSNTGSDDGSGSGTSSDTGSDDGSGSSGGSSSGEGSGGSSGDGTSSDTSSGDGWRATGPEPHGRKRRLRAPRLAHGFAPELFSATHSHPHTRTTVITDDLG